MVIFPSTTPGGALDAETIQKTADIATIWKGSLKLIEQTNSPAWTVGSPAKCTRVFVGPYAVAMDHWPLAGQTMRDMPPGWTIEDGATVVKAKGGKGVVTIPLISYTSSQVDFGKDATEEMPVHNIKRKPVDKNIELHPKFNGLVSDAFLEAIDEAINSKGAKRTAAKNIFKDDTLAMKLYGYRLKGTDQYRVWQPVVIKRYFTRYRGGAAPTDPGANTWGPNPGGPAGWEYYKTDGEIEHVWKDGKYYGWWTSEEWTGFDTKDTYLYP